MINNIFLPLVVFVIFLSVSGMAHACRCAAPNDTQSLQNYTDADLVLRVQSTEFSEGWSTTGPLVTFKILETYKTNQELGDALTAKNNPTTAACGNAFLPNTEYVLGFWDLQRAGAEVKNAIGYRVMHSCAQMGIRNYLQNKNQKSKDK